VNGIERKSIFREYADSVADGLAEILSQGARPVAASLCEAPQHCEGSCKVSPRLSNGNHRGMRKLFTTLNAVDPETSRRLSVAASS